MGVTDRQLLPAFADALPGLRALLGRRLVLVVDGANTMGSRPDGWWRDRAAASERLRDELAVRATDGLAAERLGLPGHRWYPDVVLVTEGRGRGPVGVAGADGVGGVASVRVGKCLEIEGEGLNEQQLHEICRDLLSNPVIEDYVLELQ